MQLLWLSFKLLTCAKLVQLCVERCEDVKQYKCLSLVDKLNCMPVLEDVSV